MSAYFDQTVFKELDKDLANLLANGRVPAEQLLQVQILRALRQMRKEK